MTDSRPLLPELRDVPGLEAVVLVDRAGRVVESRGVEDASRLRKMATLVAALHASGARLSEASGDPGRARIRVEAGERIFLVIPLPRPGTQVLLLVPGAGARVEEASLLDRLMERLAEELPVSPTMDSRDAAAFEASLEGSLPGRGTESPAADLGVGRSGSASTPPSPSSGGHG